MRLGDRLFRLVLWLYPSEFRDRFGDDMQARIARRVWRRHSRRRGLVEFWSGVTPMRS